MRRLAVAVLAVVPLMLGTGVAVPRLAAALPPVNGDVTGTVTDSISGQPLAGAEVVVSRNGQVVARVSADAFGRYTVHNLPEASYDVEARYIGFHSVSRQITVGGASPPVVTVALRLVPAAIELQSVEIAASLPVALDTRTGDQVFKQNDYHGAPTNTTSQILQQSISGAARAPTGEVHIRGQHAEYTYYVDGVPVTTGISGSLNELFDPAVVNDITFQTGGWDAEYGNKNTAIVNVNTRIPAGGAHLDLAGYGGSFGANGQSLAFSTNAGRFGLFLSAAAQGTDMRREPVVFDTVGNAVENFHNDGHDVFGFAKLQFLPSAGNILTLDVNRSRTRFAAPFDSAQGIIDDHQQDVNGFVNFGWRHLFGTSTEERPPSQLFFAGFYRDGSLTYTPGLTDQPSFVFFPDTTTAYNLREDRNFRSGGVKLDWAAHPQREVEVKIGGLASWTRGHEDFSTVDSAGNPGPASNSNLNGHDIGVYAQTTMGLTEQWELRAGVRYDTHVAPFAGNQHQVSPRVKLSFLPDPANTFYVYYGRLFIPTNVEDLRAITSTAQGGVAAEPTLPERDDFFEAGYLHRFPFGVVVKLSGYHKRSAPGIDDNTVPGSAIVTSVNIKQVRVTGLETVVEVRPGGPVTGYVNLALCHAYGRGPITGGFFPARTPPGYFDLDHDQRLSSVASVNYAAHRLFLNVAGTYGSGLTNGQDPDSTYSTGLFAFNPSIKVKPSFILNASVGYSVVAGNVAIRPELFVDNLLDHRYLLKGTFFSGASVGRPRAVQLRVNVGL